MNPRAEPKTVAKQGGHAATCPKSASFGTTTFGRSKTNGVARPEGELAAEAAADAVAAARPPAVFASWTRGAPSTGKLFDAASASRRVLVPFVVGTFGALGSSALDSLKHIVTHYARRVKASREMLPNSPGPQALGNTVPFQQGAS